MICGDSASLTTITKNGGDLTFASDATTVTQEGSGTMTIRGLAAITTLTVRGGTCYYNSDGTLTTATISGDGHLDLSRDERSFTITNDVEMYGNRARFSDPRIRSGSQSIDLNQGAVSTNLDLGNNIKLTRASL